MKSAGASRLLAKKRAERPIPLPGGQWKSGAPDTERAASAMHTPDIAYEQRGSNPGVRYAEKSRAG